MILETKDVAGLKIEEQGNSHRGNVILVSGLAFHSALAVDKIITKTNSDSSITMLVYLSTARSGMSGRFKYEINIPPNINTVTFGNEKVIIWKNKS